MTHDEHGGDDDMPTQERVVRLISYLAKETSRAVDIKIAKDQREMYVLVSELWPGKDFFELWRNLGNELVLLSAKAPALYS
jgi:hypothetical protein